MEGDWSWMVNGCLAELTESQSCFDLEYLAGWLAGWLAGYLFIYIYIYISLLRVARCVGKGLSRLVEGDVAILLGPFTAYLG
jgi:hypothetical protein